jgi:hypothetical protein
VKDGDADQNAQQKDSAEAMRFHVTANRLRIPKNCFEGQDPSMVRSQSIQVRHGESVVWRTGRVCYPELGFSAKLK